MKVGVVLPTFAWTPEEAWTVARSAAEHGVDGVFAYDHLWPMGNRRRPALAPFPILAAVARSFPSLCVGTLVARIGMVSDDVLIAQFRALAAVAPGRVIAAIGTGDKLSAQENLAYGIGFDPAEVRRTSLRSVMATLLDDGLEGWIGGGAQPTLELAEDLRCAVNMWGATPEQVAVQAQATEVTWAGLPSPPGEATAIESLRGQRSALEGAGASWAVFGWPVDLAGLG